MRKDRKAPLMSRELSIYLALVALCVMLVLGLKMITTYQEKDK